LNAGVSVVLLRRYEPTTSSQATTPKKNSKKFQKHLGTKESCHAICDLKVTTKNQTPSHPRALPAVEFLDHNYTSPYVYEIIQSAPYKINSLEAAMASPSALSWS